MQILTHQQIQNKIKRLAIEILEHNLDAKKLVFLGINNNGMGFAKLLLESMPVHEGTPVSLSRIRLNPAAPLKDKITIEDIDPSELSQANIIVVDDVANTGRTLFYALKPIMNVLPKKVQVAVLVDRKHKFFPIIPDYVGLSLATTMKENIEVSISDVQNQSVFLR